MTLVASLSPFGCPLMLGDILITGRPGPETRVKLPTVGEVHLVDDSVIDQGRVAWLAQKISVITDTLVVGWAGDYRAAKRIISVMRAHRWSNQLTCEEVQQCLATTEYDDQASVALVGIFAHDRGFGEFGLNAPKHHMPFFERSRIIGSGRTAFVQMAERIYDCEVETNSASGDGTFSWANALGITLGTTAGLIGEEINRGGGLSDGFGGGFEVIAFQNNKFAKVDDIIYCLWYVSSYDERGLSIAPHSAFLKIKYHGDILVIRRAGFTNQTQMIDDLFVIGPMGRRPKEDEISSVRTPDLNSTHNCHYVVVPTGSGYEVLALANLFARQSMVYFKDHEAAWCPLP